MKLDRNINPDGTGKYALIKLREIKVPFPPTPHHAIIPHQVIDFGDTPDTEFFVIRLKDKYAQPALLAYANAAREDGQTEYANEILDLANKALQHPLKKKPD